VRAPRSYFPAHRGPKPRSAVYCSSSDAGTKATNYRKTLRLEEGSYWHAIAHRIEPDSSNSAYWFRRVGEHPIFAELHRRASEILERRNARWKLKPAWDPFLFLEWCGEACHAPGSDEEQAALQIQRAEWDLLFEWCAVEPH
jgi:hypothetical protein